jgi:hypothetical protein
MLQLLAMRSGLEDYEYEHLNKSQLSQLLESKGLFKGMRTKKPPPKAKLSPLKGQNLETLQLLARRGGLEGYEHLNKSQLFQLLESVGLLKGMKNKKSSPPVVYSEPKVKVKKSDLHKRLDLGMLQTLAMRSHLESYEYEHLNKSQLYQLLVNEGFLEREEVKPKRQGLDLGMLQTLAMRSGLEEGYMELSRSKLTKLLEGMGKLEKVARYHIGLGDLQLIARRAGVENYRHLSKAQLIDYLENLKLLEKNKFV